LAPPPVATAIDTISQGDKADRQSVGWLDGWLALTKRHSQSLWP